MADDEFNIDELISGPEDSGRDVSRPNTRNTSNTGDASTTETTDSSLHPFSVRLDKHYVDIIKALAWWKRISQREFIENCIGYFLEGMEKDQLGRILDRYDKEY